MRAEVLTIGDELLRGEIVDSNKSFLSDRLLSVDADVRWHASVLDDPDDMTDAFLRAAERADVVLVSGGLGPTRDDLTIEILAETFERKLLVDEETLENLKAVFFCMPGVPSELRKMMDEQILPRLEKLRGDGLVTRAALLRTFGLGESNLDEELRGVAALEELEGVTLGFRTAFPDNYVRPMARAATAEEAEAKLARACDAIRLKLGALIYGEGAETLESVVGELLRRSGRSVAVAESCTGGLLGERITAVPGASDYFRGGVVAYANDVKTAQLGVPEAMLKEHGAVSEAVALAMAEGVRERFAADFGISTTGISGPTGGSEEKPVGLVWVGVATAQGAQAREFLFPFERERHRAVTAHVALDWIRRHLLGEEPTAPRYVRPRS